MAAYEDKINVSTSDQYGTLRKEVEAKLAPPVPMAYSTTGVKFGYEAPLSLPLPIGCYITITTQDERKYLGLVTSQEVVVRPGPEFGIKMDADMRVFIAKTSASSQVTDRVRIRYLSGHGVLLGRLENGKIQAVEEKDTFQDAKIERAAEEHVASYLEAQIPKEASLEVGTPIYGSNETIAVLRAAGFDRHTFLCGQSGSGKTFALGVILERLLLQTQIQVVVLDPNSDFVRLGDLRKLTQVNRTRSKALSSHEYDEILDRYGEVRQQMVVLRPSSTVSDRASLQESRRANLRLWFSDLERQEQALLLGLDPLRDREEFNQFWRIVQRLGKSRYSIKDVLASISDNFSSEARRVGLRIENLGIADWEIWADDGDDSLVDIIDKGSRCTVLDIGTLTSAAERSSVAMATVGHLWRRRQQRNPVLLVIDEAHNICSNSPTSELDVQSAEEIVRIAGEGRKFGIYLLLATQRPEKVHPNALSQCDNLVLMRMNSASDLQHLAQLFSQVPVDLLGRATNFTQGQALVTGKIVRDPVLLRFGGRLSHEGGGDVPVTWAGDLGPK